MLARFYTADVFTNRRFGGNQLAVFPDASGIPESALPDIAREFNLSETVFVYPPDDPRHTRRLRIFTPVTELPFAGHPTVGTAFVLATLRAIPLDEPETRIVLEEGVGPVPVTVRVDKGVPTFCQLTVAKLPEFGPPPPGRSLLADVLGIEATEISGGMYSPQAVSCGLRFLFVPVKDREVVRRARIRLDHWESTVKSYWATDIMVFSRDPERTGSDIRARAFVPGQNIVEDPATGSAAAALGGYLGSRESGAEGTFRYVIEQGFEMGRPSILEVEVEKAGNEITSVRVGGESVMVTRGEMEI
ncbi:MAG TPA: PhzF family phenazine biosynthesis protein [Gemmatimonadaceae bacterium]|nr:PhzF family phenazine biosynthesis protein [Gemmatimonadaceae bacterium]